MSDNQNTQSPDAGDQSSPAQPGGLDSLLASREYQSPPPGVSVTDNGSIIRTGNVAQSQQITEPPTSPQMQQQGTTPTEAVPQVPPPEVTTQQQGISDAERRQLADAQAYAARLEETLRRQGQVLQQQAIDTARQQDEAYVAELNRRVDEGVLTSTQAIALARQREANRTQRVAQYYQERDQERANQDSANRVSQAKSAVISRVMLMEGIPGEYRPLLDQANEPDQLDYTLDLIRPMLQGNQQQNQQQNVQAIRQELQDSGVLNPAGDGGGAPPPEPPKQRSGDLVGLLESRGYQYGSTR